MTETYLTDRQLATRYGVGRSSIWRWVREGTTFPKPYSLAERITRWKLSDIEAWEASKSESKAA